MAQNCERRYFALRVVPWILLGGLARAERIPLQFPLGLAPESSPQECEQLFEDPPLLQGDRLETWLINGRIRFEHFTPSQVAARFWRGQLFQVELTQEVAHCDELKEALENAIAYINGTYAINPDGAFTGPHFRSGNCLDYSDPGNVFWEDASNDFTVRTDSHLNKGKFMLNVDYSYNPLVQQQSEAEKEDDNDSSAKDPSPPPGL